MDRELVLAILAALVCGSALLIGGWYPAGMPVAASGRALEQRAWRRLWRPFVPPMLLLAALCGWALAEPEHAERVPAWLALGTLPFVAILTRAVWRAGRSLGNSHQERTIATVGLVRPRIVLPAHIVQALDAAALAAAAAHERAHARHRDPLRLWLARLGSDLLWPWPMAESRFSCWKRALELARDEEVRLGGIPGPDLAAAIIAALRLSQGETSWAGATLGGAPSFLEERIARLMRPLEAARSRASRRALALLAATAAVTCAVLLGAQFGEGVVRTLLAIT